MRRGGHSSAGMIKSKIHSSSRVTRLVCLPPTVRSNARHRAAYPRGVAWKSATGSRSKAPASSRIDSGSVGGLPLTQRQRVVRCGVRDAIGHAFITPFGPINLWRTSSFRRSSRNLTTYKRLLHERPRKATTGNSGDGSVVLEPLRRFRKETSQWGFSAICFSVETKKHTMTAAQQSDSLMAHLSRGTQMG